MNLLANHALRLTWLGEGLAHAGQIERAAEQAAQALALAERQGERGSQAYAWRLTGEIATLREPPDVEGAVTAYGDALGVATELGMRPLAARCRLGLATAYHRSGARANAQAELGAAFHALHALDMPHWVAQAEALGVALR
jgi:tetratricopeptide (TPR) repeat protein